MSGVEGVLHVPPKGTRPRGVAPPRSALDGLSALGREGPALDGAGHRAQEARGVRAPREVDHGALHCAPRRARRGGLADAASTPTARPQARTTSRSAGGRHRCAPRGQPRAARRAGPSGGVGSSAGSGASRARQVAAFLRVERHGTGWRDQRRLRVGLRQGTLPVDVEGLEAVTRGGREDEVVAPRPPWISRNSATTRAVDLDHEVEACVPRRSPARWPRATGSGRRAAAPWRGAGAGAGSSVRGPGRPASPGECRRGRPGRDRGPRRRAPPHLPRPARPPSGMRRRAGRRGRRSGRAARPPRGGPSGPPPKPRSGSAAQVAQGSPSASGASEPGSVRYPQDFVPAPTEAQGRPAARRGTSQPDASGLVLGHGAARGGRRRGQRGEAEAGCEAAEARWGQHGPRKVGLAVGGSRAARRSAGCLRLQQPAMAHASVRGRRAAPRPEDLRRTTRDPRRTPRDPRLPRDQAAPRARGRRDGREAQRGHRGGRAPERGRWSGDRAGGGALLREDGQVLYLVRHKIPICMVDDGVRTADL